ncbi:MAG TPA: VOC family protein [Hyphomicrobiales bacterium]|nr:VOC family protein [Hyphomicrobiales bacterium]
MPQLTGVLETAIYVGDMARAKKFYEEVMGLKPMFEDSRLIAYNAGPRSVFLVFRRGASVDAATLPGGTIPGHDGSGPLHFAFAADTQELPAWERHLAGHGVEIVSRVDWPRGGKSIYFRDPDGHVLEIATPGLWQNY